MVWWKRDVGPARAGMIRSAIIWTATDSRWPRTSGDDPGAAFGHVWETTLAPHERG